MKRGILWTALIAVLAAVVYVRAVVWTAHKQTPQILAAAEKTHGTFLDFHDLDSWQLDALLQVEDPRFFEHGGVDFRSPGAGFTTITQGLVKRLYFDDFSPGLDKLPQTLIAVFVLDATVPKKRQLSLFLNSAYFGTVGGQEVYGFERAAQAYFGKPFATISREEYLALVAMLVGPDAFNPISAPGKLEARVRRIENLLGGRCAPRDHRDVYYADCSP